jgi:hypothetical protein
MDSSFCPLFLCDFLPLKGHGIVSTPFHLSLRGDLSGGAGTSLCDPFLVPSFWLSYLSILSPPCLIADRVVTPTNNDNLSQSFVGAYWCLPFW